MNRRTIGTLCGLVIVVACQGGGSPNDFGLGPTDNAPTDPGAPSDPNAPPGNPNDPPFSDTVPGSSADCTTVCNEIVTLCPDANGDVNECIRDCNSEIPPQCRNQAIAFVRCIARNGCEFDEPGPQTDPNDPQLGVCEAEILTYATCLGPQPPDGGEGGAGGI